MAISRREAGFGEPVRLARGRPECIGKAGDNSNFMEI